MKSEFECFECGKKVEFDPKQRDILYGRYFKRIGGNTYILCEGCRTGLFRCVNYPINDEMVSANLRELIIKKTRREDIMPNGQ